jgi:hypothetical protein
MRASMNDSKVGIELPISVLEARALLRKLGNTELKGDVELIQKIDDRLTYMLRYRRQVVRT